ncbi:DUF1059 domain-containing protein [Euzebya rosea]|uniref:DUF1059 domain-containing protein n=1 Tax=Euzebya rosea TaxID=2052804 RepID=UPI000D3EA42D|nr:DUF1059 domain-containing protein [Euzebya rosea]
MKKFECNNVVAGCDGVVTGETEDDVLREVADHAAAAHGMHDLPETVVEQVRSGITEA